METSWEIVQFAYNIKVSHPCLFDVILGETFCGCGRRDSNNFRPNDWKFLKTLVWVAPGTNMNEWTHWKALSHRINHTIQLYPISIEHRDQMIQVAYQQHPFGKTPAADALVNSCRLGLLPPAAPTSTTAQEVVQNIARSSLIAKWGWGRKAKN